MFGWFRRVFNILGRKANAALDKMEDPKLALNQILKDMNQDIHNARVALNHAEIQAKKSRKQQESFYIQSKEYEANAEKALVGGDEKRATYMLRRSEEMVKTSEGFRTAAEQLELDIEKLKESIRKKELKYQEAKTKKAAMLAQQSAAENLAGLNKKMGYSDNSNAFIEFDRINERIDDQVTESHAIFTTSTDGCSSYEDSFLTESTVESKLDAMKRKLNPSLYLEDKSDEDDDDFIEFQDDEDDEEDYIRPARRRTSMGKPSSKNTKK